MVLPGLAFRRSGRVLTTLSSAPHLKTAVLASQGHREWAGDAPGRHLRREPGKPYITPGSRARTVREPGRHDAAVSRPVGERRMLG